MKKNDENARIPNKAKLVNSLEIRLIKYKIECSKITPKGKDAKYIARFNLAFFALLIKT